ncbi:MAG: DNA repair protein RecN [Leptospirales bacterium]|nr:DNA repair protein RecN [Leptospirales bacterium]
MLTELRIKNFVIIEDLAITFEKGLNVLSGETGAGKSILIDAISGVLGEKMTVDMIRTGFEKAVLEGVFDVSGLKTAVEILADSGIDCDDDTLIMRRELYASGKGRCFINSTQVPVQKLREVSECLIDIHGQNENQTIVNISKHRELLDNFASLVPLVASVRACYNDLASVRQKLASFNIDEKEKQRRIDFNTFALKEIDSANLSSSEEIELRKESVILANAEKLFTGTSRSYDILAGDGGIFQRLREAASALSSISEYDVEISNILESVDQAAFALEDAAAALRDYSGKTDFSPERVNQVEERLSLIQSLKKKYGDTVESILEYAEKARKELEAVISGDEEAGRLQADERRYIEAAKKTALELSAERVKAAAALEEKVVKELRELGMEGMAFKIEIKQEQSAEGDVESGGKTYMLYPHGLDRVEFLISVNAGEELKPLRKVASGGEMSRIMLAFKNVILAADIVDTLIFDEVDSGVGGKTADIVGRKLKQLSKERQVLLITHLPQIASMSDSHYFIQKSKTGDRITTSVRRLNRKEKIREVARMLAGETITDLSIRHAEEMIENAETK